MYEIYLACQTPPQIFITPTVTMQWKLHKINIRNIKKCHFTAHHLDITKLRMGTGNDTMHIIVYFAKRFVTVNHLGLYFSLVQLWTGVVVVMILTNRRPAFSLMSDSWGRKWLDRWTLARIQMDQPLSFRLINNSCSKNKILSLSMLWSAISHIALCDINSSQWEILRAQPWH